MDGLSPLSAEEDATIACPGSQWAVAPGIIIIYYFFCPPKFLICKKILSLIYSNA